MGQLVGETLRLYGRHFWAVLPVGLAPAVLDQVLTNSSRVIWLLAMLTAGAVLMTLAYIRACVIVLEVRANRRRLALASGIAVTPDDLPPTLVTTALGTVAPSRERRRRTADDLYEQLVKGEFDFWNHVQTLFLNRDLTRHDLQEIIRRGLRTTGGSYRALLPLFHLDAADYKKFLNFLATHDCRIDYRQFRTGAAESPDALAS